MSGDRSDGDDIVDPEGKDDEVYREMTRQQVPSLARLAHVLFGMPEGEVAAYEAAAEAAEFAFGGEAAGGSGQEQAQARQRGRRQA